MKLFQALKLRKKLTGEINKLKSQLIEKNSYIAGSINGEKFDAHKAYDELVAKTNDLVNLKFVIAEANHNIQADIFSLAETKGLLIFNSELNVTEGIKSERYSDDTHEFHAHISEEERDSRVVELQKKIDAIQQELDEYNYSTEVQWKETDWQEDTLPF